MDDYGSSTILNNYYPSQKRPDREKDIEWMKQNVDSAELVAMYGQNTGIRNSIYNKQLNYNLYRGIIDESDIRELVNPYGINGNFFPKDLTHYPIATPKLNLLIGEELRRRFDWKVVIKNPDAVTEKEKEISGRLFQLVSKAIASQNLDEASLKKKLEELDQWSNYSMQDYREIMGTQALQYLFKEQELKLKFNQGFKDVLIAGEEIYRCDIVNGNPTLDRVNPLNVFLLRMGDSQYVEDADIIIEFGYYPLGSVIDQYYDHLSSEEISTLEEGARLLNSSSGLLNYNFQEYNAPIQALYNNDVAEIVLGNDPIMSKVYGGGYDQYGNIKVVHTVWRSLRKIGKLSFFDEQGQQQETIVPEQYKPDKSKGEKVEWIYINEWWEGTKIANEIYVKMQPRPVQFRKMTNLSECSSGYVGTLYNTNNNKVDSLLDRLRPYSYLYDIYMDRLNKMFAKNPGVIGKLDIARKPAGWDVDKWLHYATTMGFMFEDSFNEGRKGQATGKLAGGMQQGSNVLNMDVSNYIQSHVMILDRLKREMGEISGISEQRQGAVDNRETVGGVERAVNQSNLVTEEWFAVHDNVKLRAMTALLETSKIAWKNNKQKVPYIFDDMSSKLFEFGGEEFCNSEYGIFVNNSSEDMELFGAIRRLAEAGLQNNKLTFSQMMDLYVTQSTSSLIRKLENAEKKAERIQQQNVEEQNKLKQADIEAENKRKDDELRLMQYKIDTDNETKIRVAEINALTKEKVADINADGGVDVIAESSLALDELKHESEAFHKTLAIEHQEKVHEDKMKLEQDKLDTQKEIADKKADAEKHKIDTQYKIAKMNKKKADK